MAKGEIRTRMVAGAVHLLAERGLEGTSFAGVLEATGASRGSTYHHFPGGKRELVLAAVELAGAHAHALMEEVRGEPAAAVVRRFVGLWRQLLEATDLRAGCAVLAVTVAADDDGERDAAGRVFRSWRAQLESLLAESGLTQERARSLAALVIAATEGAVAMARAEYSSEPFELVAEHLVALAS